MKQGCVLLFLNSRMRALQNARAKTRKITEAETNTLENFCFVVAALCESVGEWNFQRIQNFSRPVAAGRNTGSELKY